LYVNPEEIVSISSAAEQLSSVIDMSKADLEYLFRKRELRYIPIINKISIHVSEFLKSYLADEKSALNK
jgi:hypothetical protein